MTALLDCRMPARRLETDVEVWEVREEAILSTLDREQKHGFVEDSQASTGKRVIGG